MRIMKRILLITLLSGLGFVITGCVQETIIVAPSPAASVVWDFWAGARHVEVDGEVFNDGNTFIRGVELEVRMFDDHGHFISSVFHNINVNLDPQRVAGFSLDIEERYVFDVEVRIHRLW